MSTWSGAVIGIRLARLDDLNSLALIRHDAGQLFELPKAEAQRVN
jgi:hypothetical protein